MIDRDDTTSIDEQVKDELIRRGHTHRKLGLIKGCPRCEFLYAKYCKRES